MEDALFEFKSYVSQYNFSKIIIVTDETIAGLYPDYFDFIPEDRKLQITIPVSESAKVLSVCEKLWLKLLENGIDKEALWVNFGGGSVSDVGAFVCATYKRGLLMVNYPTTLLAMIDAAIGGKNGINLKQIKNVLGTFYFPEKIFFDPSLLATLPQTELENGFAELLKYGLIQDSDLWMEMSHLSLLDYQTVKPLWIERAVEIKRQIVEQDRFDHCERRILNFGHTVGHALESFFMCSPTPMSHGYAVAVGMCYEAYFALSKGRLSKVECYEILKFIGKFYNFPVFSPSEVEVLVSFCLQDKKWMHGVLRIPLLIEIGKAIPDERITEMEMNELLVVDLKKVFIK